MAKGTKYTPIAKRQERPSAIKWLLKEFPSITDTEICKLIRTTKNTVDSIRNKSHWNYENIITKDPLKLGFCSEKDLNKISDIHKKENETTTSDVVKEISNEKNNDENDELKKMSTDKSTNRKLRNHRICILYFSVNVIEIRDIF